MHPSIHPLQTARVIKKGHRHGVGEHPLRGGRIGGSVEPCQRRQRAKISQSEIAGYAEHRGIEVMRGAVDAAEECRQLELADGHIEPGVLQACLHHLLQRRLAAAHGEELEADPRPDGARRSWTPGDGGHRKIARGRWRHRAESRRAEAVDVAVNQLPAIDGIAQGTPDVKPVERRPPGVEDDAVGHEQWIAHHLEIRVAANELGVGGLNAGEVELTGGERRQLGRRLIHHHNDEPLQTRRSTQRRGEGGVRGEDPAAVRLV